MAEVFAIGCAVSLVKIADLAAGLARPRLLDVRGLWSRHRGAGRHHDRWSVWRSLERAP
jgi:hypothetical protein